MKKKLSVALMLLVLAAGAASPATASNHTIVATDDNEWMPFRLRVKKGTTVVWKNPSTNSETHDVRAYGGTWNKDVYLEPGERTSKTFRKVGRYRYRCVLHSFMQDGCNGMCGVVRVFRPS